MRPALVTVNSSINEMRLPMRYAVVIEKAENNYSAYA
jgi:hypothetical protein